MFQVAARRSLKRPDMTRTPFDHFAKALVIGHESPFGRAESELELPGESQFADLAWTPDLKRLPRHPRDALDRMARVASLWEFFHQTPSRETLLGCVQKLLAWFARRSADARKQNRKAPPFPLLWAVSAGCPRRLLDGVAFERLRGWPSGFYADRVYGRVRIVVVSQLPRERRTLLLRLMGAGRTLREAIADLGALPHDAPERILALPHLVQLRIGPAFTEHRPMNHKQFLKITDDLVREHEQMIEARGIQRGIERGIEQGIERGIAPLFGLIARKLRRPLTDSDRRAITARLDLIGPDRLGEVVLDFNGDALAAWLADPDAR